MKFTVEQGVARKYLRISDPCYHYTFGYYSNNSWVDENRIVMCRFLSKNPRNPEDRYANQLVLVDIAAQTEEYLVDAADYVVAGTKVYYILDREILCYYDLESRKSREILRYKGMEFPHMTRDGRYLNWHHDGEGEEGNSGMRIDLQTGEVVTMFTKKFAPPFTVSNHMMLSPTDPDTIFFSHEGVTFYVSNRLWIAKLGEEPRNIAKQKLNADGDLGDCFGHECWAADGKGLYFVKYPCSPEPPRGLCYVDLATNEVKMLFSKFPYWHVSADNGGRYLAADTQSGDRSWVCLADMKTGEEIQLADCRINWVHPCHPHPHFNTNDTKLAFHELDDAGQVVVGIMDVV